MSGVVAVGLFVIAASACDQALPVAVGTTAGSASFSHIPWTGCTAWDPGPRDVTFAKGSSALDAGDLAILDENVTLLNLCPDDGFHVVGVAVSEPKAKHVAAARAQAVADYYVGKGVSASRMETSSYVAAGCGGKKWGPCDYLRAAMTLVY